MSKVKGQAIASLGGITGHIQGKAHQWTKEEASKAGRIGSLGRPLHIRQMHMRKLKWYPAFMKEPNTWIQRLREAKPHRERTDLQRHYRNVAILQSYLTANTGMPELSQEYGISRDRVYQIVQRYLLLLHKAMRQAGRKCRLRRNKTGLRGMNS